ncbi:hypothetical protein, partial [Breoghania sp.]|uniref:hypothetical protein n=1 Tax=Breoghania sp. TaxID=2065378 RepID=UPI0029CA1A04
TLGVFLGLLALLDGAHLGLAKGCGTSGRFISRQRAQDVAATTLLLALTAAARTLPVLLSRTLGLLLGSGSLRRRLGGLRCLRRLGRLRGGLRSCLRSGFALGGLLAGGIIRRFFFSTTTCFVRP